MRREVWTRLAAAVVFAPVAGISVAAILSYVLGSVDTNFWGVAAGLTLGIAAALLPVLGLGSLFGRMGRVRPTATAGCDRDPTALDGLLLRGGCDERGRGSCLLGCGGRSES